MASDYNNYRPISISSILDKIIQKYIGNVLMNYLELYKLIDDRQYAYQKGKSTNKLLNEMSNYINGELSKNKHVIALFVDLSKAFDTLNLLILLRELLKIGISGPVLDLIQSFLQNRKTVVEINGVYSDELLNNCGVPQGSNLGPILFLIYINSIFTVFKNCKIFMFADDLLIIVSDEDFQKAVNNMQINLNYLIRWAHDFCLVINVKKTKVMHIFNKYLRKDERIDLIAHNNKCLHQFGNNCKCMKIENVDDYRYLGVQIDKNFSMNVHINSIIRKLRSTIPQITALKFKMSEELLRTIYYGLVFPFIMYGICMWGSIESGAMTKLTKMQTKILKKMIKKNVDMDIDVFKYWNVLSVNNIFKYCFIRENLSEEWDGSLREHNYRTRTMENEPLFTPKNLNRFQNRTCHYLMPRLLNELPINIRNLECENFLKNVKEFYLS